MSTQNSKLKKLKSILKQMCSVLIAFSGGVDSSFLLKVASEVLPKDKILAVTANSATYPKEELLSAKNTARAFGARHRVINTGELRDLRFVSNPVNRCYFCKSELFSRLQDIAEKNKLSFVVDASNISDKSDFRPGNRAKKELKVRSPLQEAGLNKEDIRRLSKKFGLVTWDKPALACLASRIPYGVRITPRLLEKINRGEEYLRKIGFKQVRLRHYNGLCRIEVPKQDIRRLLKASDSLVEKFRDLGYNHITVDLEGYRTGSLNEVIKK